MSRELRARKHNTGLILANGGMLTHQYAICLSAKPRKGGKPYPKVNPLPEIYDTSKQSFTEKADGAATIEVRFNGLVTLPIANQRIDIYDRIRSRWPTVAWSYRWQIKELRREIPCQPRRRGYAVTSRCDGRGTHWSERHRPQR